MFSYLITDPNFYTKSNFVETLDKALIAHKPDFICYRNKQYFDEEQILNLISCCKNKKLHTILNGSVELAKKYSFNGVHLTSTQYNLIVESKKSGLLTIASCHNRQDIESCVNMGADYVTLSPLYNSPNKGEPLGVEKFCEIADGYFSKIIALGGIINQKQIFEISKLNLAGYASIRYFIND